MTVNVVAIGGGHGLSATLKALAGLEVAITAVVAVADDGGSSGRLREQFDVLPPGDLRMALTSLASDSQLKSVWEHRFAGDGDLAGHSVGNLLITALWQQFGVVEGMRIAGDLLSARGAVIPVSLTPHHLVATVDEGDGRTRRLVGQATIAAATEAVTGLATEPSSVSATAEALAAIAQADAILIGPGSWFTSVIAPLLVHDVAAAVVEASAPVGLIVNLAPEEAISGDRESDGFSVDDYLQSLGAFAGIQPDVVIVDAGTAADRAPARTGSGRAIPQLVAPLREPGRGIHDPKMLAHTLRGWLSSFAV